MSSKRRSYWTHWQDWIDILYPCAMGAHEACKGRTFYRCPRTPTGVCRCECHQSNGGHPITWDCRNETLLADQLRALIAAAEREGR